MTQYFLRFKNEGENEVKEMRLFVGNMEEAIKEADEIRVRAGRAWSGFSKWEVIKLKREAK